ncbi:MAG: alpha/beta hydrolase [Pseudomonadota bacterium]
MIFLGALGLTAGAVAITKFHLDGPNLSKYDTGQFPVTFTPDPESEGAQKVKAYLVENFVKPAAGKGSRAEKLHAKRKRFDAAGARRSFPDIEFRDDVAKLDGLEVTGEWVLPPNADANRRLLYIHGGANTVGSALSHRAITTNIAKRAGCAVFAINYRLMPENSRQDGIDDCRAAYRWMVENGPDGPAPASHTAVAGDSAGANLTLSLINWVRDEGHRVPDAVVVISPPTDSTGQSPSIKGNFETDIMLQPLIGDLLKVPRSALLWLLWRGMKIPPSSPVVSPIYADLSGLPPILIHVSAAEMLYDDARRYAAKANAAGTDVTLQSWAHMAHVWHVFDEMLPEAHQAFDEINGFLKKHGVAG